MKALKAAGEVKKWGKIMEDRPQRRNVFLGDLKKVRAWSWSCAAGGDPDRTVLHAHRIAANPSVSSMRIMKLQQVRACLLVSNRRWESKSHPLWPFLRYASGMLYMRALVCLHSLFLVA